MNADTQKSLEQIDGEVDAALEALSDQQREFVRQLVDGYARSAADALRIAGSASNNPARMAYNQKQLPHVKHAIEVLGRRRELMLGIHDSRKRRYLQDIVELHTKENPGAAVSAIKELNAMDGSHAPKQVEMTGHVQVTQVQMMIDSGRPAIDVTPQTVDDDYTEPTYKTPNWLT